MRHRTEPSSTTPMSSSALHPEDLVLLQSWVGREQTCQDWMAPAPLRGLSATLDRTEDVAPETGTVLPPLWHWLYFLPHAPQCEIGEDGHPRRGGFLPPVALPRRMWAGGQLHWEAQNPLRVGQKVQRHSRIAHVTHKAGRTGDLVFVQVEHALHNEQGVSVREVHDIVYRPHPQPGQSAPAPQKAPSATAWQRTLVPDAVQLFRYSALTFNAHRIHYDRSYVTQVEGYPGLVVHGPLIATLLLDLVRRHEPSACVKSFRFKAIRPSFDGNALRLNAQPSEDGRSITLWAADHEDCLTMQAHIDLY